MGSSRDAIEPTVLLVGAGERFTPAFQAALGRYRVQVETAELGTVMDAVIVTAPDLVLLMGDAAKDGGAFVLQKLAGLSQNFTVPVVVLNDDEELDQKLSAFRHGATAVLPRSASVDATAAEVAKMARDIPEQGADSQGALGEATLDEFIGALSRQLRTGLVSSLSAEPESGSDLKLVLGRGRPLTEFLDTFVRRVRRHVVRAERLEYELGSGSDAEGGPRASLPAAKAEIRGLRAVLADDDTPRADAVAQELRSRGVTVVVTDLEPSETRFQTLRQADPTVLVIGEDHAHGAGYELLRKVRRDSRLRWASLLVVRWNEIWSEERGAPVIHRLESTLAGLIESERALYARAEARAPFDTRLETTGPARCLRTLGALTPALRVHVANPRVELTIDLSDGLVVGAEGRTLTADAKQLSGVSALAALLVLGSGRVRVEPVDQPATANVMTPVDAALNMADAETPPIAPSIPAAGTISLNPPMHAEAPPVSVPSLSLSPSLLNSVRPAPIVPVGTQAAGVAVPRPAATPGFAVPPPPGFAPPAPARPAARPATPPPAELPAPPIPVAPFPLSASAQMPAQPVPAPMAAAGVDLSTPAHERNPPAMTVSAPLPAAPLGEAPLGARMAGGFAVQWAELAAWFARQDAKLHGKRISGSVAAVLVGLGALQGLLIVLLYAGARWLVAPHRPPEPTIAARELAREGTTKAAGTSEPVPAKPAPPATAASDLPVPPPPSPPLAVAPSGSDGSGHDVPDCKTLLAADPPHNGYYPGAALQAMRAGRTAIVRGDLNLAQMSLCRAANYNPKNAEIALELSLVLLLRRDGAQAETWARRAVELAPNNLGAQDALGDALARVGNESEAKKAWITAARIDGTNESAVRALVTRAAKQADNALRHRDLVTAERSFRRAAVLEPKSQASRSGLAYVLLELGDLEAAVTWARRGVEVSPRNSGARLVLGDALAKSGDKAGAGREWREAALLDPGNREALKRLRAAGLSVH
ncbi:MAG TPA: tetratricopeptide repeat protein [Polyangiaceae bacterium]|nr:tetratricopeptide repeat protein [Polyangiaceae bacterium]